MQCYNFSHGSLKTNLTKWKPDYDSAASEYAKAGKGWIIVLFTEVRPITELYMKIKFFAFPAVCFKNAKQFEQAKDAYLKEAEYHTENKTYPFFMELSVSPFLFNWI